MPDHPNRRSYEAVQRGNYNVRYNFVNVPVIGLVESDQDE